MTTKDLIALLQKYPSDTQVFMARDEEVNSIQGIASYEDIVLQKTNNDGGFDALLLVPDGQEREVYDDTE